MRNRGSSDIPWRNSHFDGAVISILMQPRIYLQYLPFTECYWVTGNGVSGLTQAMCIFEWATTIMSP